MSSWDIGVVTDKGKEALAKVEAGTAEIIFTGMAIGSGVYSVQDKATLTRRTALKNQELAAEIASKRITPPSTFIVKASFSNETVSDDFDITECGVMAEVTEGGVTTAVLFAIGITDTPDVMSKYNGSYPQIVTNEFYLPISNSENITVEISLTAYALADDLDEHVNDTSNPHNVTKAQLGIGDVANDSKDQTTSFTSSDVADGEASAWTSVTKLETGEKHSSIFAKVSQMFKNIRYLYSIRPDALSSSSNTPADNDIVISKENGGTAWVTKTMSKVWDYIKGKIGISNSGSTFLKKDGTWATPLGDFVATSDVTIDSVTYHTYWEVAPTSSNQVYGVAIHPTNGKLVRIYNNKGTYTLQYYDKDSNTTTGDGIKTKVAQTGTAQNAIASTIAANTTMDNAIGTLLNNDATLNSQRPDALSSSSNTPADNDIVISKEDGGTAWVKKTMSKLWAYIDSKIAGHNYLECSTGRNTANKVVAYTGFELRTGSRIAVRFTNTGTSNPSSGNLTLNVNSTGAKTIVNGRTNKTVMTYANADYFYNNKVAEFVYDGTYWVYVGNIDPVYDTALSTTSENAVQNKKVTSGISHALSKLAETDLTYSDKASRPHTAGDYLIYGTVANPKFGKVQTNVSANEAWNTGSGGNITDVDIATELTTLNSDLSNQEKDWKVVFYYETQTATPTYTRTNSLITKIGHLVFLTFTINITSRGNGINPRFTSYNYKLPYKPNATAIGKLIVEGTNVAIIKAEKDNNEYFSIKNLDGSDGTVQTFTQGNVTGTIVYTTDDVD